MGWEVENKNESSAGLIYITNRYKLPYENQVFLPLLAQCCLYFTDSDQRPQVFELGAVLGHADAAHGVSFFT